MTQDELAGLVDKLEKRVEQAGQANIYLEKRIKELEGRLNDHTQWFETVHRIQNMLMDYMAKREKEDMRILSLIAGAPPEIQKVVQEYAAARPQYRDRGV